MTRNVWRLIETLFLLAGLVLLDYYVWEQAATGASQAYASWTFDRELRGQPVSVGRFVADQLRALTGHPAVTQPERPASENPAMTPATKPALPQRPEMNALIGRLEIPRVGVKAIVREGTDSDILERAVGHIPYTALPGENGNVAIAAHRDTFFRGLAGIRPSDVIVFHTLKGNYRYEVQSTRIVSPKDVSVIGPTPDKELTMITCYPFHYIGSAPERFIVRAREIDAGTEADEKPLKPSRPHAHARVALAADETYSASGRAAPAAF